MDAIWNSVYGGSDLRNIILAALVASLFVGMAAAMDTDYTKTSNMTFDFEQSVEGSGYFMTYRYIQLDTPNTETQKGPMYKDYAHGSGTIDNEIVIQAIDTIREEESGGYTETETYSCISAQEDNSMVYSPMTMAYGNGYYARNPIRYDSLLKEKTCIKNYRPLTSMHHEVEYAKALDKEINVIVKDKYYTYSDPLYQGVGYTTMNIVEDVTDGRTHIGVLQGEPNSMNNTGYDYPAMGKDSHAWKNPMIEIDEDYIGTYHIEKNMTLEVPYKHEIIESDWLTCCFGGCDDDKYGPNEYGYGSYFNPCEECM